MNTADILIWPRHLIGFENDSTGPGSGQLFTSGEVLAKYDVKKSPHQKHIRSLTIWKPGHPFWQVAFDFMGALPIQVETNTFCLLEICFKNDMKQIPWATKKLHR